MVDQLLVTAQLDGMIPPDRMMEIGRIRFLPRVIDVQHTESRTRILQNRLVGNCFLIHLCRLLLDEITVIQITAVHRPEIDQNQYRHPCAYKSRRSLLVLRFPEPDKQPGSQQDEDQRTQRIGRSQRSAVHQQGRVIPLRNLALELRIICRPEIQQQGRHQPKDHTKASGQSQSPKESFSQTSFFYFFGQNLPQPPNSDDRKYQSRYHQRHLDCTELIVQRQIMEHQVVERIEITSQRKECQEHRSSQQPPFHRVPDHEHPQDEQEADQRPEIDRPGSEYLISPIGIGLYFFPHLGPVFLQLLV